MFAWLHPARVLAARPELSLGARLLLIAFGAAPVSLVGLSTFDWIGLRPLALTVLAPLTAAAIALAIARPAARRLVLAALVIGPTATLLYDLFRWTFLLAGWMDRDPIPHIGTALGAEPGWVVGYLWRFAGNGGGLALVFLTLGGRGVEAGMGHGLLICSGLVMVLVVAPNGQEALFPINPISLYMAITGHVIYGAVVGHLAERRAQRPRSGPTPDPAAQSSSSSSSSSSSISASMVDRKHN